MLGSITPLGERGRRQRWWITVTAHSVGATVAGALLGGVLGWAGSVAPGADAPAIAMLGGLIAVGAVLEGAVFRGRLPGPRRQVNEDWLARYRGWVYGVGFGVQLGLGVVTVVTTTAVYLTFGAAFLSASAAAGALMGAVFGLLRASTLLTVRRVRSPDRLFAVDARLGAWAAPSRRLAVAAQGALVVAAFGVALVGQ